MKAKRETKVKLEVTSLVLICAGNENIKLEFLWVRFLSKVTDKSLISRFREKPSAILKLLLSSISL